LLARLVVRAMFWMGRQVLSQAWKTENEPDTGWFEQKTDH